MSRIKQVEPEKATAEVKTFYNSLQSQIGRIPNIFLHMGNSPAVLQGYFALSEAASKTTFPPLLREQIALVVGETNACRYCLSAHTAIGKSAGLSDDDVFNARKGTAKDPKTTAILQFAKLIVEKRGHLSEREVEAVKQKGITDKEIAETVLLVILNTFTNYFNLVTDTKIDFPIVPEKV